MTWVLDEFRSRDCCSRKSLSFASDSDRVVAMSGTCFPGAKKQTSSTYWTVVREGQNSRDIKTVQYCKPQ